MDPNMNRQSDLYPSAEDLKDLSGYVSASFDSIEASGIVKIVLPADARRPNLVKFVTSLGKQKEHVDNQRTHHQQLVPSVIHPGQVFTLVATTEDSSSISFLDIFQSRAASQLVGYPSPNHFETIHEISNAAENDSLWKHGRVVEVFTPDIVLALEKATWDMAGEPRLRVYDAERDVTSYPSRISASKDPVPNLAALGDPLSHLRHQHGVVFSGINTSYTYFGAPETFFALHLEDLDLCSLNISLAGAPKIWYGVKGGQKDKVLAMLRDLQPEEYSACSLHYRHKSTIVKPDVFEKYGIALTRIVQYPGEIIVTTPHAFHQGINLGVNLHEAVNFMVPQWERYGDDAEVCSCMDGRFEGWSEMTTELSYHAGITLSAHQKAVYKKSCL